MSTLHFNEVCILFYEKIIMRDERESWVWGVCRVHLYLTDGNKIKLYT
jgi:hypothetical protein